MRIPPKSQAIGGYHWAEDAQINVVWLALKGQPNLGCETSLNIVARENIFYPTLPAYHTDERNSFREKICNEQVSNPQLLRVLLFVYIQHLLLACHPLLLI